MPSGPNAADGISQVMRIAHIKVCVVQHLHGQNIKRVVPRRRLPRVGGPLKIEMAPRLQRLHVQPLAGCNLGRVGLRECEFLSRTRSQRFRSHQVKQVALKAVREHKIRIEGHGVFEARANIIGKCEIGHDGGVKRIDRRLTCSCNFKPVRIAHHGLWLHGFTLAQVIGYDATVFLDPGDGAE